MKTPNGVVVGEKYVIYHVAKNLEISTIISEFKVVGSRKMANETIIECVPTKKTKNSMESFDLKLGAYGDNHVMQQKIKQKGELF